MSVVVDRTDMLILVLNDGAERLCGQHVCFLLLIHKLMATEMRCWNMSHLHDRYRNGRLFAVSYCENRILLIPVTMIKGKRRATSSLKAIPNGTAGEANGCAQQQQQQQKQNGKILKYVYLVPKNSTMKRETFPDGGELVKKAENGVNPLDTVAAASAAVAVAVDQFIKSERLEAPVEHSNGHVLNGVHSSSSTSSAISKLAISSPKCPPAPLNGSRKCLGKVSVKKKYEDSSQSQITDFYQMRRSNRKRRSLILKEQQELMEQKIMSAVEDGLQVRNIVGKGRGVVTTKDFKRGEFVVEYSGELVDFGVAKKRDAEYARDRRIGCYMYYFVHKDRKYCVDATEETGRFGRLINHSRNGNLSTKTVVVDGVPRLVLLANRDIPPGQELCYDYGDRSKESVQAYPWLAS